METNESSSQWLIYWFGELTLGPPTANWEAIMRLHHRSDGFGTVADDGGSNALCAGIRYRF
jgi:fatty-acid desaturase